MLKFYDFLQEEKASKEDFGNLSANEKGVLHELLVGYHLFGGRHMKKHTDINGDSPQEVHDRIKNMLTEEQYENFSSRASKAAQNILKEKNIKPEDIANVQWTSKAGDIKRSTGIESSQNEDDSDLILSHKDGTHHGMSLKVSDDNKPITLSNNGAESTFGGKGIFTNHVKKLKEDYPAIGDVKKDPSIMRAALNRVISKAAARGVSLSPDDAKISSGEARKAWLESNPNVKLDIKNRTTTMLNSVMENMHSQLKKLSPQELSDHLRNSVLHAYKTPKETLGAGHTHIRHFTGGGFDPHFESKKPGEDYEHFLSDPENIHITRNGSSITYHYHDKETNKMIPFAHQSAKQSSQSDPTSSLVIVGKDVERKQDILDKERIRNNYLKRTPQTVSVSSSKPEIPKSAEEMGSGQHGPIGFSKSDDPTHLSNKLGVKQ